MSLETTVGDTQLPLGTLGLHFIILFSRVSFPLLKTAADFTPPPWNVWNVWNVATGGGGGGGWVGPGTPPAPDNIPNIPPFFRMSAMFGILPGVVPFEPLRTIGISRIRFHHFIFRELFLVIVSSWLTSKHSGRIISRNLSDLHLLPHLLRLTQSLHQTILGELIFVKSSCALHQNILGELTS